MKTSKFKRDRYRQMMGVINAEAELRLGIAIADEIARQEERKRRLREPLTTEEKIFKIK